MDMDKINAAINHFEFSSTPSSGNGNDPATVSDIRKVVNNTAEVLRIIASELENDSSN